jgi:hypothetical protein
MSNDSTSLSLTQTSCYRFGLRVRLAAKEKPPCALAVRGKQTDR